MLKSYWDNEKKMHVTAVEGIDLAAELEKLEREHPELYAAFVELAMADYEISRDDLIKPHPDFKVIPVGQNPDYDPEEDLPPSQRSEKYWNKRRRAERR